MITCAKSALNGLGEKRVADEQNDLDKRLVVVETTLTQMQAGISDLTKAVRSIADQPRAIPFKEIAGTVLVCFGIFAYVGGFIETQYRKNNAVLEYRVCVLEKNTSCVK